MNCEIKTIILGGSSGNCYLIKSSLGFVLIDTGSKGKRKKLEIELEKAGCTPDNFHLVILTHGDFDHSGNCAYLKEKYNVEISMHVNDEEMVKTGDQFYHWKDGRRLFRRILTALFSIRRFTPDFTIDEGFSLSTYGINARIIHLPGHSAGSIGILTDNGDFFCGDLFTNTDKPELNSILQDEMDAKYSIKKLKNYLIDIIYPGHGNPFPLNYLTP